jgi:hypothetical protein
MDSVDVFLSFFLSFCLSGHQFQRIGKNTIKPRDRTNRQKRRKSRVNRMRAGKEHRLQTTAQAKSRNLQYRHKEREKTTTRAGEIK